MRKKTLSQLGSERLHTSRIAFDILVRNIWVYLVFLQLRAFSELKFQNGKQMVGTFRPVQPLNGRQVFRSGGAAILASSALLVAAIAMAFALSPVD